MTTKADAPDKNKPRATRSRRIDHSKATAEFLGRAQQWLLARPDRAVRYPQDLDRISFAVGVPCPNCGAIARSQSYAGHTIVWKYQPTAQHWAAGITATCKG